MGASWSARVCICHVTWLQAAKHIHMQPSELNVSLTIKMLNPQAHKWMWLCRNLKLRSCSYLSVSRTPVPNFSAEDAAVVEKAVREQMENVPGTLSTECVPVLSPVVSDSNLPRSVLRIDFNWGALHRAHADTTSLLDSARSTLVTGKSRTANGGGRGAQPGAGKQSRHRRPPSGRGEKGVDKPTSRRRPPAGAAASAGLPLSATKTVRGLRSAAVQRKFKQAHEAVVSAMMEEDKKIDVVKPNYLVQRVAPHKLWPDGGVVVYAQFPFLLDQSWRDSGAWVAWCRKVMCAPDGRSHGGTYEVFFTLQKDVQGSGERSDSSGSSDDSDDFPCVESDDMSQEGDETAVALRARTQGRGGPVQREMAGDPREVGVTAAAAGRAGSLVGAGGTAAAADGTGNSVADRGSTGVGGITVRAAGDMAGPDKSAGAGASEGGGDSSFPAARSGRSAGRPESAGRGAGRAAGAGRIGGRVAGARRSGRQAAAAGRSAGDPADDDASRNPSASLDAVGNSGGRPVAGREGGQSLAAASQGRSRGSAVAHTSGGRPAGSGVADVSPGEAARSGVHGGDDTSVRGGDDSDTVGGFGGVAAGAGGSAPGAAGSGGSSGAVGGSNGSSPVAGGGSGANAPVGGGSGSGSGSGSSSRAPTVGSRGSTSGASAVRTGSATRALPTSQGLHNLYLSAMRCTNDALGLAPGERQPVVTIVQSPPSSFSMNCTFYSDMDLDTTDPDQLSCQTDSYITAAYRARPRVVPSVRRVHE